MRIAKYFWIGGGIVLASMLDLAYMFWSRSQSGGNFNKAIWNSTGIGKGKFNIMGAAKHFSNKGKY